MSCARHSGWTSPRRMGESSSEEGPSRSSIGRKKCVRGHFSIFNRTHFNLFFSVSVCNRKIGIFALQFALSNCMIRSTDLSNGNGASTSSMRFRHARKWHSMIRYTKSKSPRSTSETHLRFLMRNSCETCRTPLLFDNNNVMSPSHNE